MRLQGSPQKNGTEDRVLRFFLGFTFVRPLRLSVHLPRPPSYAFFGPLGPPLSKSAVVIVNLLFVPFEEEILR